MLLCTTRLSKALPTTCAVPLGLGDDLGATDSAGFTPLHFAARQGQAEAAKLLIDAGAPREARNKFGKTPLWVALMNRRTGQGDEVVASLIAAGACIDSVNDSGVSVRDIAKRMGVGLTSA